MRVLPVCMCTMSVPGTGGSQKKARDSLGLELQMVMVMNHLWVLGTEPGSIARKCAQL